MFQIKLKQITLHTGIKYLKYSSYIMICLINYKSLHFNVLAIINS